MINKKGKSLARPILILILILESFALPTQFYLLLKSNEFAILESILRFFSFFTILTNSIVALCCGVILFMKTSQAYAFFHRNSTLTAITVYILIVGLVYNIILRPLQDLTGIHKLNTEIFHTVVPLLFLLYWYFFTQKENIHWKSILIWLIYPVLYMIYTLFHGLYTDFYPYPFINVTKIGFTKAMQNGMFVLVSFVVMSLILIGIGKLRIKKYS
ncbi:hypothetical protein C8C83_4983 [Flavobacterium sp. 90]|uniref:Pr6Pr family membrane protein n=1 Tax=unclassified Flavobacterium TaxID=196869 RepID=UPI000EAF9E3D|nr:MULTISPECIES: Pr6Pr family membrane protein [unclassified Flavobacterium]RKR05632.1 hypothetical protein C8C82_5327 [Flavobacterium sp. 81]TCK56945.1 hypothetical protein C8C83_4983 [Flavobacterium sp. 90]